MIPICFFFRFLYRLQEIMRCFKIEKFDYRFHYDANQTNRMFVRTSYFSLSLRSTEETIPHTPNMQQENSVRKRAKTRKRRRKRYIVWKDSWRKEWWMYVARLFLYYFYSYVLYRCTVECWSVALFCCWTMAIRRSLFDCSNKLFVVFVCLCVCLCARACIITFYECERTSATRSYKMLKNKCERDVNVERAFVFVLCMRRLTAMPHNTIKNTTQSFTCTWHSIDKLLIAWAYACVCVAAGCIKRFQLNATTQSNQINRLTLAALVARKISILTSQFSSLVLWLLPCGILIWCFDFQFFVQPMRSVYVARSRDTNRKRISVSYEERKKTETQHENVFESTKASHPEKPWLSFSSHHWNCCNFDVLLFFSRLVLFFLLK